MPSVIKTILNLLFPPRCLVCSHLGSYLCPPCTSMIYINIAETICPVCKKPAMDGATHPGCKTKTSLDGLAFFWRYKGPVHKIIHKIKYNPFIFTAIEDIVSNILLRCPSEVPLSGTKGDSQKPLLVPVPLHSSRLRYRGYNHAEKIAQAFGKKWHLKVISNLLIRTRATKPQAKLKLHERQQNIKGAFAINNSYNSCGTQFTLSLSKGGTFILVDDVWTSGSTLSECCRVLKQNGAQKVWALTLAR